MSYIASPSVHVYARSKGVDLEALAAATKRQTLAREDIDQHLSGHSPADASRYWDVDHAAYGPVSQEPLPRVACMVADNLSASHAMIPQVTHHDHANMHAVENLRQELKSQSAARGLKLTALAFHVKALTLSLQAFPRFNSSLTADGTTRVQKHYLHIGVAIDTPHGLLVPVIRDANRKGLWQIAQEIGDLAARARARQIRPDEMGGASMTITNLGGIGGTAFTPIINPPESAILGITRTQTSPVWNGEAFKPVPLAPLDLSYDHRVINGAEAARFLTHHGQLLADPRRMLI